MRKDGAVEYIPGVGIDIDKINSIEGNKEKLCKELSIPEDSILLLSVGELNDNKNHKIVIESLASLPENIHYLICGVGPLKEQHIKLSKELNVENRLHLLGYRNNIIEIMKSCDVFIFPSKREGLSVALMEAMACELPCVVSKIRGNVDLIKDKVNGIIVENNTSVCWKKSIMKNIRIDLSKSEIENYTIETVSKKILKIYKEANSKKKIIFLRSNPVNPDSRVEKEASTLIQNGFEVEVIGWDREKIIN